MSVTKQIGELCGAGFTVNMVYSPSQEEGKINATFLLSGDKHLADLNGRALNAHTSDEILKLIKKPIQIPPSTPEELEQVVLAELKPVVEERVPISNSIKEEYDKIQANKKTPVKKTTPAKKTTAVKKKTKAQEAKEQARAKAEKATADLPLFQSDRSAKAKESLSKSLSSGDNSTCNSSQEESSDEEVFEL